jgi:uncharacterized protein YndB with AHSA1/START domain
MDFATTVEVAAPPEIVYNTLTDPHRVDRWLPAGVRLQRLDADRIRVETRGSAAEFETSMDTANLRVSWRSTGPADLSGDVHVMDQPAGGSTVHVAVTTSEEGPSPEVIRRLVDEAIRHLRRDVSDNFTAG